MIASADMRVYGNPADGERMVAERVRNFRRKYRILETLSRQSRFLTFERISELAAEHDLRLRIHRPWPGWRRKFKQIRARFGCTVPLIVLEK
jgi:hypothetical protein